MINACPSRDYAPVRQLISIILSEVPSRTTQSVTTHINEATVPQDSVHEYSGTVAGSGFGGPDGVPNNATVAAHSFHAVKLVPGMIGNRRVGESSWREMHLLGAKSVKRSDTSTPAQWMRRKISPRFTTLRRRVK